MKKLFRLDQDSWATPIQVIAIVALYLLAILTASTIIFVWVKFVLEPIWRL